MRIVRPATVNDAALVSSNVPETDYAAWSAATTYPLGAFVIKTATHRVYKSLQAGNLNHDPATEPATPVWWQDWGATNRWKMFDDLVGVQTSNADSIAVALTFAERIDSVILLNVSAASVRVTMTDVTDGVVFDQTYNMVSDSGITDWYAYFFEPIVRKSDLSVTGLPPYINARLDITLTDPGATVLCGECIAGLSRYLGGAQYGAKVGIQDYSVKTTDAFGNYTILERAFARRGSFSVWMDAGIISETQTLLASFRATPTVYIGSDDIDATIIYGFYKDFDITIAYPDVSLCNLEIEGLT